ncbi:hypothetical protein V6N13_051369 [Hibiscus sabdariffa]
MITLTEAPADVSGLPNIAVSRRVTDRLTHVQVPLTWNLSPLRPSKFSFEYLLLPPRSTPKAAPPRLTPQTPWSVFQDGPDGEPAGRRPEHAGAEALRDGACWVPRSRRRRLHGRIKSPGLGRHHDSHRSTPRAGWRTGSRLSISDRGASPAPIRFPPDNFKHSLNLFSKSFSSYPRGTCSLSVSHPYLALDGNYRPIRAAFPNNPTHKKRLMVRQGLGTTALSPSPAPLSRGLGPGPPLRTLLQTTIRTPRAINFQTGLFPVRSPLLRQSLFSGLLATSRVAIRPRRHDPNTSPDHSIGSSDGRAGGTTRPIKARSASPVVGTSRLVLTVRRTGGPTPRSNYELFNCNNLNIRYWSSNYRGCWHRTCPPMETM